jgi:hypothetical protein
MRLYCGSDSVDDSDDYGTVYNNDRDGGMGTTTNNEECVRNITVS